MPGQNDLWPWLQSIMQNQGAGQPNSVAGMPRYGAGPGNLGMGDPTGLTAPTPGAPSMGYPAQGQPVAQPQPAQTPPLPSPLGWAVTPANAAETGPNQSNPWPRSPWPDIDDSSLYGQPPPQPNQPQPAPVPNGPATSPHMPWPGSPSPQTYPHMPWPPNADNSHMPWPDTGAPTGSPSATPKPVGPLASSGGGGAPMKRTPGAPNLGYYQGNNNRFVQVDRPNASAAGGFGRGGPPQMTALNLAGLFGGRGQPAAAVNPANVPAANAQPVSALASGQSGGMVPDAYPGDNWDIDAQGNVVPSFGDPRRKQGFKSSSSSQGGGY